MAPYVDSFYSAILRECLNGDVIQSRNEVTFRAIVQTMIFHESPLIQIRKTAWKHALLEMEWFLSGSNNIKDLDPKVHHWWKPWASANGSIKNNYGTQFRRFAGRFSDIDQVNYAIETLKKQPFSRRNVISTWNAADMTHPSTPITNCHGTIIQFFVNSEQTLDMAMYQRSCDMILGVPHNLIQYWAFLIWIANRTGLKIGRFFWTGGDCHIYEPHIDLAEEIVDLAFDNTKKPWKSYKLLYNPTSENFKASDFSLDKKYEPILKKSTKMVI